MSFVAFSSFVFCSLIISSSGAKAAFASVAAFSSFPKFAFVSASSFSAPSFAVVASLIAVACLSFSAAILVVIFCSNSGYPGKENVFSVPLLVTTVISNGEINFFVGLLL